MIGALVLSMGLLGTGYAYWTDALQVNTTVTTGKFDMEFVAGSESVNASEDGKNYVGQYKVTGEGVEKIADDSGLVGTVTTEEGKDANEVVTFTAHNLYPTASVEFNVGIKNAGTIAAKLGTVATDDIELNTGGNTYLQKALSYKVQVGNGGAVEAENSTKLAEAINTAFNRIVVEPQNDKTTLKITATLKPVDGSDNNKTQMGSAILTINFPWEQWNTEAPSAEETPDSSVDGQ